VDDVVVVGSSLVEVAVVSGPNEEDGTVVVGSLLPPPQPVMVRAVALSTTDLVTI